MSTPTTRMGRPSIFPNKKGGRVQGGLTDVGSKQFNVARGRLADLAGWKVKDVTDADTIEYLARGHEETKRYLQGR